jgi:hypothetical protein
MGIESGGLKHTHTSALCYVMALVLCQKLCSGANIYREFLVGTIIIHLMAGDVPVRSSYV